jgi:hypothetical protein
MLDCRAPVGVTFTSDAGLALATPVPLELASPVGAGMDAVALVPLLFFLLLYGAVSIFSFEARIEYCSISMYQ